MIAIMSPDLSSLFQSMPGHESRFATGVAVFHLGDPIELMHFVCGGIIHLVRHQENGAPLILQRAHMGSVLAEASVYSDVYHCDARAETAAIAWSIPRAALQRRLKDDAGAAEIWSRHLAHEVQRARLHAEILALKTVGARLTAWIGWNGSLPAKGHWRELAGELGVSPEALYREIARHRRTSAG